MLAQDPETRSACEVACTKNEVIIFGEVTTAARVDYESAAREVIAGIGYTAPDRGFDTENCHITVKLNEQSPDIAMGITRRGRAEELDSGAGDQGIMFGCACRETDSLMPLPIELAHSLAKRLEQVRRTGELSYLLPDGKTQVTVEYEEERPVRIASVIVSAQHREEVETSILRSDVIAHIIMPALPKVLIDAKTQYFVNPTGRFVIGGPAGDSGLTGRKSAVDTYGGYARHGGGALSGKDASKVDRSGAYMARYMAKNVVAAGLARHCEVQLGYAIGLAEPVAVQVDTFGTGRVPSGVIKEALMRLTDLRPMAITRKFGLMKPIYSSVSCYGHFGNNAERMPWESTELSESLKELLY